MIWLAVLWVLSDLWWRSELRPRRRPRIGGVADLVDLLLLGARSGRDRRDCLALATEFARPELAEGLATCVARIDRGHSVDGALSALAGLDPATFVTPESLRYEARDGLELQGLLYVPNAADFDRKPPVVVKVHGGPTGQSRPTFQAQVQYLVNNGIAVFDAIKVMADHAVGSLLVMDGEQLIGIVTERDYARKVILKGRSSETTPVGEVMSTALVTATPEQTVDHCMALMTEKRIRHLPIVNGERLIGVISIGDLVQAIISDQQEAIEHLENYISG